MQKSSFKYIKKNKRCRIFDQDAADVLNFGITSGQQPKLPEEL